MFLRHIIIFTLLCCCSLYVTAQEKAYRSESIRAAITRLGLAGMADTLRPGVSTLVCKGRQLRLNINKEREVVSIGMPLFSKTMRRLQPSPIYDFLEYALLDNTFSISDNPFTYRRVRFVKGNWSDLLSVDDNTSVGINNVDGRSYRITWSKGKRVVAEMTFPVQYDMLSGSTHLEQERNFIRDLGRYSPHGAVVPDSITPRHRESLELRFSDGDAHYYVCRGDKLYAESITDDTYYVMGGDSVCRLLYAKDYPAESLCNTLLTGAACNKEVDVTVMGQDFSRTQLQTTVSALAGFLKSGGCRSFFELKRNTDKELQFSVYAENRSSGYTHLFIFTCSPHHALGGRTPLEARAFLFIPTSNIKSLFAERETP